MAVSEQAKFSAIHWAAKNNAAQSMELMLAAKASVDILNYANSTALHAAACNNSTEATQLLIAAKASLSIPTRVSACCS